MTEKDIAKLRAAGFSDSDIQDYIKSQGSGQPTQAVSPTQVATEDLPEVDMNQPSETLKAAKAAGTPTTVDNSSYMPEAMAAGSWMAEHPIATGAAALGAGKLLSKVPVVGPAVSAAANKVGGAVIPGYEFAKNAMTGLGNAAETWANTSSKNTAMETYKGLQHTASQYVKSGQPVPQGLIDMLKDIESKIVQQGAGPVNPATAPGAQATAEAATKAAAPAAEAAGGIMSRISPYLQAAGKVAAPVARVLSSAPAIGAQLALHSGGLNQGEDQRMAEIRKWQDNFAKLPVAQQNAYYNLPRDKQQQVNALIASGQDPSSILGQNNAMTSGYARQLQQLGR